MSNQIEAESRYIIVAFTDIPKRHKGTKRRFTAEYNGPMVLKSETERKAEIDRARRICKKCPLRRKCKFEIYETISYQNRLLTAPAIDGYKMANYKCPQARGTKNGILYTNKNH